MMRLRKSTTRKWSFKMSKEVKKLVVTPTGRICFNKHLFVAGGEKNRYSCALVFSSEQDLSKIKNLMMETAKAKFDEKEIKSAKFSWGIKKVDVNELEFLNDGDLIMNVDRNGEFQPPEVKGNKKGPDGKYEDLIDGDIKAGDYCRLLVSAFAWEYKGKRGVKLNFDAVQFVKTGEAYYSIPTSDSAWDKEELDVEVEEVFKTETEEENWDDVGF